MTEGPFVPFDARHGAQPSSSTRSSDPSAGSDASADLTPLARDVRTGLLAQPKRLPSYLFYDATGSALYEQITLLPEYYPTRTEAQILAEHADEIVEAASVYLEPFIAELGAGTFPKTESILAAVVKRQGRCLYVPTDVSPSALRSGVRRLKQNLPQVEARPFVGLHEQAFEAIRQLNQPCMVLFIGSSIGNLSDAEAVNLLSGLRRHLERGSTLLLGTDMKKSEQVLLPAYDDSRGVTAAFNKNVLSHLNRVLGADFDVSSFDHVARWNESESRIEMHLKSKKSQLASIMNLGLQIRFEEGELVHTESSVKYDLARVDAILARSGFARVRTFSDVNQWFGVHLAEVA